MNAGNLVIWTLCFLNVFIHCSNAAYKCYEWTAEDQKEIGSKPSIAKEKAQCEKRHLIFTQENNGTYEGCETCSCCKRVSLGAKRESFGLANILNMRCSLLKKITGISDRQCFS
ncbi:uncharacterized protein LOC132724189 [Ruditapes philippinarum]|uniref:uncharacterized protein LOC132724189 n=1 Tax=Ruditapes philippinarum TaxID=129788 RepID=UPI00295C0B6F|nr:uncharacterized protein LOC132724189 [Ruditapes philippinarum]